MKKQLIYVLILLLLSIYNGTVGPYKDPNNNFIIENAEFFEGRPVNMNGYVKKIESGFIELRYNGHGFKVISNSFPELREGDIININGISFLFSNGYVYGVDIEKISEKNNYRIFYLSFLGLIFVIIQIYFNRRFIKEGLIYCQIG